jgi:hypothetical protein
LGYVKITEHISVRHVPLLDYERLLNISVPGKSQPVDHIKITENTSVPGKTQPVDYIKITENTSVQGKTQPVDYIRITEHIRVRQEASLRTDKDYSNTSVPGQSKLWLT